jgi:hypothetical protein
MQKVHKTWVLSQIQDGRERIIAYYNKTLNRSREIAASSGGEVLAMVKTLNQFHKYLYGQFSLTVPVAHWPLSINLAHEIRTSSYKQPAGVSACMNTTSLQSTVKAEKRPSLPQSRGAGRCQAGTSYYNFSHIRLRSSLSENWTTEWPGHRSHSGGSRNRTAPRMQRHDHPHPRSKVTGPNVSPSLWEMEC